MAEDDVEGCIRVGKGISISDLKGAVRDPATACHVFPGSFEYCLNGVHAGDLSLWDELGEVRSDGSWTTPDVQDGVVRFEVRQKEGGAILCRASGVAIYYTGMVAMSIGRLFLSNGHVNSIFRKLGDKRSSRRDAVTN